MLQVASLMLSMQLPSRLEHLINATNTGAYNGGYTLGTRTQHTPNTNRVCQTSDQLQTDPLIVSCCTAQHLTTAHTGQKAGHQNTARHNSDTCSVRFSHQDWCTHVQVKQRCQSNPHSTVHLLRIEKYICVVICACVYWATNLAPHQHTATCCNSLQAASRTTA
jgi:predicted nucleic acid-binding Zn ribbon protein